MSTEDTERFEAGVVDAGCDDGAAEIVEEGVVADIAYIGNTRIILMWRSPVQEFCTNIV